MPTMAAFVGLMTHDHIRIISPDNYNYNTTQNGVYITPQGVNIRAQKKGFRPFSSF